MKLNHFYSYFYAIRKIKKLDSKLEKDGWVINGNLYLDYLSLYFLPIIKKCKLLNLSKNNLKSLYGCPDIVDGYFNCSSNQLSSLQYCPIIVLGYFNCSNNYIKNLNYSPKFITGDFYSTDNFITDYKKLDLIRHRNYLYEKNSNATLHKYS